MIANKHIVMAVLARYDNKRPAPSACATQRINNFCLVSYQ
jgi:hypothetical protein